MADPITLTPMPGAQGMMLNSNAAWSGANVEVLDAAGQVVLTSRIMDERMLVPCGSLAPGIYIIRSLSGPRNWSQRFLWAGN